LAVDGVHRQDGGYMFTLDIDVEFDNGFDNGFDIGFDKYAAA
jgi:hypothetical protein